MMIETFRTETFQQEVLNSQTPVLVDFWAPWCSHCHVLDPVLKEFSQDAKNIRMGKVNVDEEPELARKYGIMSIPTVLCVRDGRVTAKKTAPQDIEDLENLLS